MTRSVTAAQVLMSWPPSIRISGSTIGTSPFSWKPACSAMSSAMNDTFHLPIQGCTCRAYGSFEAFLDRLYMGWKNCWHPDTAGSPSSMAG